MSSAQEEYNVNESSDDESGYSYTDFYGDDGDSADEDVGIAVAEESWNSVHTRFTKEADQDPDR